jgi:hypothetical protein
MNRLGEGRFELSPMSTLLLFLVAPWAYGFTAWPTLLPVHWSLILFLLSATLTVRALARQTVSYLAFLLFALSCLTYEACYLQFVPVLVLGWVLSPHRVRKSYVFKLMLTLAGFCLAQGAAVGLKSWVCGSLTGPKSFNPMWFPLAKRVAIEFPNTLLGAAAGFRTLPRWSFLLLGLLFLLSFISIRVRLGRQVWMNFAVQVSGKNVAALTLAAGCIAALAAGVLLSVVLHAMAHYRIRSQGLESRTTLVATLWLSLLAGVLGGRFAATDTALRRGLRLVLVTLLLVGLGVASSKRLGDWAGAWELERAVLQAAPTQQMAALPPGALIVARVPNAYHGVDVYNAPWDLGHAICFTFPGFATHLVEGVWVFPHNPEWRTAWDGKVLQQSFKGSPPAWSFPGKEVWIWDYFTKQFYRAPQDRLVLE